MFGSLHKLGAALAAAFALTALLGASANAASLAPSTVRSNPVTFTNTTMAANAAADIGTVIVNNDAGGQITFQVNFARSLTKTDSATILIDADQNPATGDQTRAGADYALSDDENTNTWDLQQWNGTGWVQAPSTSTVRVSGGSGTSQLTFSVNQKEIAVTTGFNFWIDSMDGNGGSGHEAQAPNSTWNYQLQGASTVQGGGNAVHLAVLTTLAPARVKAGGTYAAGMVVQRSDTLAFLGAEGQIRCTATLRGKDFPALASSVVQVTYHGIKVSVPMCLWQLPRAARGATIRGTISVSYQGAQVTRQFSAIVR